MKHGTDWSNLFSVVAVILLFCGTSLYGQERALKLIENGKFDDAQRFISKRYDEEPTDIILNYSLAKLFNSRGFTSYRTDSAYFFIKRVERFFAEVNEKELSKLADVLNADSVSNVKRDICKGAFDDARAKNSLSGYEHFMAVYRDAGGLLVEAEMQRDKVAFEAADKLRTVEAYQTFIEKYPRAQQRSLAVKRRNSVAFQLAERANTVESFQSFMDSYPTADEVPEAERRRDELAFDIAAAKNTIESYEDFVSRYPRAADRSKAIGRIHALAYAAALKMNTVGGFDDFMSRYPSSTEYPMAVARRNALAFAEAVRQNTVEGFEAFMNSYPRADQVGRAVDMRDSLALKTARAAGSAQAMSEFLDHYPNSKFITDARGTYESLLFREQTQNSSPWSYVAFLENHPELETVRRWAEDSLYRHAIRLHDAASMEYYYNHCSYCDRDENLSRLFFEVYTFSGDKESVDEFEGKYPGLMDDQTIGAERYLANQADELFTGFLNAISNRQKLDPYLVRLDAFIKEAAPRHIAFVALQQLLRPSLTGKQYDAALAKVKLYSRYFGKGNAEIQNLTAVLARKADATVQIKALGSPVNSFTDEYAPVISANNKSLFFCAKGRSGASVDKEDIYVATLGKTSTVQPLSEINTDDGNEAPEAISADGTELLVFRDGDIMRSFKTEEGWSGLQSIEDTGAGDHDDEDESGINTRFWEADSHLTSDGQVVLFSSDRPGGIGQYHQKGEFFHGSYGGNIDIYVAVKDENGYWGPPINLGATINTPYVDRSPFLHPDMKTLYFSSNGHAGLGKQDVFKSTRLYDTSWRYWSVPVNMGKEINTAENEWGYEITTEGDRAFFASQTLDRGEDIFSVNLPAHLRPNFVATISGRLADRNNKPMAARIRWEDLESRQQMGESNSDPMSGEYFIVLPMGRNYGYFVDREDYFPLSANLDLRQEKKPRVVQKNIAMVSFREMIEEGIAVPANNLFFRSNDFQLLSGSWPELDRIAKIITDYDLKVEIAGHTDNIGDAALNQKLSEMRATAVREYLVKKGCPDRLLVTVGFGDTRPVGGNDTEDGRARNRRVELRFVK